jgi:hypothetical protein
LLLCNLLDNHDTFRFPSEPSSWLGPTHLVLQTLGSQGCASGGGPAAALTHQALAAGVMRSDALTLPEEEIQRRYHVALLLLFTLPGIPQLYYGSELGLYGAEDPKNRRSMPPWAWTAQDRRRPRSERDPTMPRVCLPEPDTTFNWCCELLRLRGANAALHSGYYAELCRPNRNQDVYAFYRGSKNNRVVVIINESDQQHRPVELPLRSNDDIRQPDKDTLQDGAVFERLLDQNSAPRELEVRRGKLQVNMPARSVGVYRLREPKRP